MHSFLYLCTALQNYFSTSVFKWINTELIHDLILITVFNQMTFGNLNTTSVWSNPAVLPVWLTAARSSVSVSPTGLRHLASLWLPGAECGSGKVHSAAGSGSACGRLARSSRRRSLLFPPSILTVSKPHRAAERWLDGYRRVLSTAAQGKLRKPTPARRTRASGVSDGRVRSVDCH